jgi:hypothetical protein
MTDCYLHLGQSKHSIIMTWIICELKWPIHYFQWVHLLTAQTHVLDGHEYYLIRK